MKRVLIITYYWPPSGGAGVQRWLKFSKYLPEYGWQPVIYTPENPEAPVDDPSLLEDIHPDTLVIKRPIWEPYHLYKRFVGMGSGERINAGFLKENEKSEKKEGLSVWIRGNLFIPDARKFWIKPSARFLKKYLKDKPVDAIISTGPPHSMHLIALSLKRSLGLPWIADFRDPWTEIDFYDQLRLSRRSDRKHKIQENAVLHGADRVVVIGQQMAERFKSRNNADARVIPNGYDEADFSDLPVKNDTCFTIVHVGALNADRNHPIFWQVIAELIAEDPELAELLKVKLVGKTDVSVQQDIARYGLEDSVEIQAYLPHKQIIPLLQSADLLYLSINNTPNARSIRTGKIFEYLAARRPILGIGPEDGDAATVIRECKAGEMVGFGDSDKLKTVLLNWLELHRKGEFKHLDTNASKYSRKHLSSQLSDLLNAIS
ncbi:MAG: glycosyltransferase family 4 protein [Bacteroidota bacterium]